MSLKEGALDTGFVSVCMRAKEARGRGFYVSMVLLAVAIFDGKGALHV